jgi:FAD:protein FMN transferase
MTSSSFLALLFLFQTTSLQPYEAVEPHMGTLFRIKLYAADQQHADTAFRAAFARVAQLDAELSDYLPDSELNRLSTTAVKRPVKISDDLLRVIEASQKLAVQTDGAFDITIGPLSHLWREARKTKRIPDAQAIAEAKEKCGYRKLRLDAAARTVAFDRAGMQLDVGAIAKGYAADEALAVITKQGIRSALVAASGDLAFSDAPPGATGWKIGIDSLDDARRPFTRILKLTNRAVSTSGAEEQHLDAGKVRYSHIIEPNSGMGVTRNLTVTVVATKGIDADGLDTAISVVGLERGKALIEQYPDCAFIAVFQKGDETQLVESRRAAELRGAAR